MLDTSPENLLHEIRQAEQVRDAHLELMEDQVEAYHGPHYNMLKLGGQYNPENHAFEVLSLLAPSLVFANPRVRVTSRRPGQQKKVAQAMYHGLNRWVRDIDLRLRLMPAVIDAFFNFGVMLTGLAPRPGMSRNRLPEQVRENFPRNTSARNPATPQWPVTNRISQKTFFQDALALSADEARFQGHAWIADKEDVLAEAEADPESWNVDAVRALVEEVGVSQWPGRDETNAIRRREIRGFDMWIPEIEVEGEPGADEGFNGTIFTIGYAQEGYSDESPNAERDDENVVMLRPPRPYYGPRWGPYAQFGFYHVPDSVFPLAPLTAVEGQVRDLNEHVSAAQRSAARYKRIVLVDGDDRKLPKVIAKSEHDFVIPIPGLDRTKVVPVEIAGVTDHMIQYIEMARDRLDRNSGLTDSMRGNVAGRGTATENVIAQEAATTRSDFLKQRIEDGLNRVLMTAAWYMYHDDEVVFPMGGEAEQEIGQNPWFQGGEHDPESGATFDDLELELEPYSLQRTTEEANRARWQRGSQIVMETVPLMPQTPWFKWREFYAEIGKSENLPGFEELIDETVLAAVQQRALEEGPEAQPRFKADVGKAGLGLKTGTPHPLAAAPKASASPLGPGGMDGGRSQMAAAARLA